MVLYSQEEIEQAEEVLQYFRTPARIEMLAMFQERLFLLRYDSKYKENNDACEVLDDLIRWIEIPLHGELGKLGVKIEGSYPGISPNDLIEKLRQEYWSSRHSEEAGRASA